MQGTKLLHNIIEKSSFNIHSKRIKSVTNAVDALLIGKELTLTAIGRASLGEAKERHAIRRTDRLVGNVKLHEDIPKFYSILTSQLAAMSGIIYVLVDWSSANDKKNWFILRASLALKGRSFTLYQEVHSVQNSPTIERSFLTKLKAILPTQLKVVIVTDAGFRCPWFKAVEELGFDWIGRIRNRNKCRDKNTLNWIDTSHLYKEAKNKATFYSEMTLAKSNSINCSFVLVKKEIKGRKRLNRKGERRRSNASIRSARSAREPWLIGTSLSVNTQAAANKIIKLYEKRMQIEEEFRDTKSHRYGFGLRYSLTNIGKRLETLLLMATLATFVCWLIALSGKRKNRHLDYQSNSVKTDGVLSIVYLACRLIRKGEQFSKKELLMSLEQLQGMVRLGAAL